MNQRRSNSPGPSPSRPMERTCVPAASKIRTSLDTASATATEPLDSLARPRTRENHSSSLPSSSPT